MSYGSALVIIKNSNNEYFVVSRNKKNKERKKTKNKKSVFKFEN